VRAENSAGVHVKIKMFFNQQSIRCSQCTKLFALAGVL